VRNVLVTVIDNDSAGILITELRRDAYDNGTTVLEGSATHGITDSYTIELTKAPTAPGDDPAGVRRQAAQPVAEQHHFRRQQLERAVTISSLRSTTRCAKTRSCR
jgi:hypothetical protein